MENKTQINRIIVWRGIDPSVDFLIDENNLSSWNPYTVEKQNDYQKQFIETLTDKVANITDGTEWGIAFRQTNELNPTFQTKIYLDRPDFLNEIIEAIQSSNKDIVFNCLIDGDLSDYINQKYWKDPITDDHE
jgi:lantibiotic modifying enzyme